MKITDPGQLAPDAALLMDTHVWVWLANGDATRLTTRMVEVLERAARDQRLWVSSFSVWEIALRAENGDLLVAADLHAWVAEQRASPGVRLLGLTPGLAIDVTQLPRWLRRADGRPHKDPVDRFLVATARRRNAILITCDGPMLDYADEGHVTALDARP